jgi:hypothetical protein
MQIGSDADEEGPWSLVSTSPASYFLPVFRGGSSCFSDLLLHEPGSHFEKIAKSNERTIESGNLAA